MNKQIVILVALAIVAIFIFIQFSPSPIIQIGQKIEVTDFKTCALYSPVLESYPRQCNFKGVHYVEDISQKCEPEQRNIDVCIEIYQPVCATVNIQCITTPCNPVKETFSNSCNACKNSLVESYAPGECVGD